MADDRRTRPARLRSRPRRRHGDPRRARATPTSSGSPTVAGNAALEHTTRNALVTCDLAGIDVPVHSGAAGPLSGPTAGRRARARQRRPRRGRDPASRSRTVARRPTPPASSSRPPRATPGSGSSRSGRSRTSRSRSQRDPELAHRVAGISIMGGGTFGNATAAAEFNIWADPEAADDRVRAAARGSACAASTSRTRSAPTASSSPRSSSSARRSATFVAGLLRHYAQRIVELVGEDLAALHDPCSVLAVTHPELFGFGTTGCASSSTAPTPAA